MEVLFGYFNVVDDNLLLAGSYNPWLVILSICIAIFAAFMGFEVATQAARSRRKSRRTGLLITGSLALGGGVWSMHFIGMLAFELCTSVGYDWRITTLSIIPSIAASYVALSLLTKSAIRPAQILVGGILVGAGIGTMHYVGMAAMQMAPLLRYDLAIFALSILVAVVLAMLSLWVRYGLDRFGHLALAPRAANGLAAVVMGCAISGMHYTGMAAARFVRPPGLELSEQPSEISYFLAMGVAVTTVVIITMVLGVGLLMRYQDTSQRAKASALRVRAMMDTAVDGIVTINSQGTVLSVNQAVERILGWSPEELIGDNVKKLVPAPDKQQHDNYIAAYLKSKQAKIIGTGREVEAMHKDGSLVDVRLGIGHVNLGDEDIFVAFISDIRERLTMERALRENEAKFRSLISNIPGIAYRCLNEGNWPMVFISDAVETITGFPAKDFLQPSPIRSFADLYHPDDREKIDACSVNDGPFSLEYRIIDANGQIRWVFEHGCLYQNEESGETWLDGFIMDITDRKIMEQDLVVAKDKAEAAASARAAFLANMSHEIRTPMNAIIGFSDILLESAADDERHKHLTTINRSAKSLLHLLNDILDSAKLDKGKVELEQQVFSLTDVVDNVVSTLWLQAKRKGLTLSAEIDPRIGRQYQGAPDRIRQVLTNLLGNAVKFTLEGKVSLSVIPISNQRVQFKVSDTGIGMTDQQMAKIFEPFAQADASMNRRFGGTGLGTTISKQLVELMGGSIEVVSELDRGSTFTVVLPLTPLDKAPEQKTSTETRLPPLTILVVDDIEQNIELLTLMLNRNGHKVHTARDGQQALVWMQREDIDVVLMDLQMPVMDGLTAARERREEEEAQALQRLPIIALTASVLDADKQAAEQAGMDGFANKPVHLPSICAEIARVLGLSDAPDASTPTATNQAVIDEKRGFSLWQSQQRLYQEIDKYLQQWPQELAQLRKDIAAQDWTSLQRRGHRLKGVAANLALSRLAASLNQLEAADTASAAEKQLSAVSRDIDDITQALVSLAANVEDTSYNQSASIDRQVICAALARLGEDCQHNTYQEADLRLLESLSASRYSEQAEAIISAIDDFNFAQAQQSIQTLTDSLSCEED